ncbi:MAG: hypothetical protein ACYS8K_06845 [Planctomycetota bacterium]|jgi:hypothetical protein
MGSELNGSPQEADAPRGTEEEEPHAGSLVPFYGVPGIAPGIQAFRRGNIILYTVRGEPQKVLELMGQLDKQGVDEVVALISHEAAEELPPPPEDATENEQ